MKRPALVATTLTLGAASDIQVPEHEVETQTDEFLDRPASPMFIPIKTGVDKETQILEGDLFDFELEVTQPWPSTTHCVHAKSYCLRWWKGSSSETERVWRGTSRTVWWHVCFQPKHAWFALCRTISL